VVKNFIQDNIDFIQMEVLKMDQLDEIILDYCSRINTLHEEYQEVLKDNLELLNKTTKLKYICAYASIVFGYGKEIAILQDMNWNTSVEPMGRDLLEGYSIFKKMVDKYDDEAEFEAFVRYLIAIDLDQDLKIYYEIKRDRTYVDIIKKGNTLKTFLVRFENVINRYYPEEANNIDLHNKEASLKKIIENIYEQYEKIYRETKNISIGKALMSNGEWKIDSGGFGYEGAYSVYRSLCHATHQSISSVEDRLITHGHFTLNKPSKNTVATVCLVYYCLRDVLSDLNICINKMVI
jgi:hypothetical protein